MRDLCRTPIFEPAVRHLGTQRNVIVNPHRAKIEVNAEALGATMVTGPDAGGKTILHIIRFV